VTRLSDGSRPLRPPKATKKPESAGRVRAPCTARYDAGRLRRLQELSVNVAHPHNPLHRKRRRSRNRRAVSERHAQRAMTRAASGA
jgi:hypothetical protein